MGILFAELLVGVTGLLIVVLPILFAVIQDPADDAHLAPKQVTPREMLASSPQRIETRTVRLLTQPRLARGRAVYAKQRCRVCHSIGGEGNTRSPLDGVSARLTEKEIRLWIVAPQKMNPAVAKRGYQLSEEDLNALVAYVAASSHR